MASHHNGGRGRVTWIIHLGSNSIPVRRIRNFSFSLEESEGEYERMGAKRERATIERKRATEKERERATEKERGREQE